jgi:hypothetical protein
VTDTVPVPPRLRRRLWIGLAGGVTSLAVTSVQGLVRRDFDPWHQAISALSLGPGGWLQVLNLVAFGIVVLTTVAPWRTILAGGRGAAAFPALTALVGIGFVGVGLIRQDPAPGYDPDRLLLAAPSPLGLAHLAIAGVAALSSVAGLFVIAARFAGDPDWSRWSLYSCGTALFMVACVAVYGVWSVQPTGFAGTFERAALVAPLVWLYCFLRRLQRGVPFMRAQVAARST